MACFLAAIVVTILSLTRAQGKLFLFYLVYNFMNAKVAFLKNEIFNLIICSSALIFKMISLLLPFS